MANAAVPEVMVDSRPFLEPKGLQCTHQGKVRDTYDLGNRTLLIVATDRISTFDSVHPNGIPGKGGVLNEMSTFWLTHPLIGRICQTHYLRPVLEWGIPAGKRVVKCPEIATRAMIVRRAKPLPVECIVRGYITGSLYAEYKEKGGSERGVIIAGNPYQAGWKDSDRLPRPVFTPTTKTQVGHDQNLTKEEFLSVLDKDQNAAAVLLEVSMAIYDMAAEYALRRGVIIADAKFEFGIDEETREVILIDEVLTPDSSRFWDLNDYEPGRPQRAMDKQYVRDWGIKSGWNREPPAPKLPAEVVAETAARYQEIKKRLID
ncbi:MAG TPA: phosphoribosylaminoimidazolesuccinocarboxamide synthase [Candidatus Nanoarchaeia archaeon]|nr:phosphoribosylaminoimidazole-succinocarboxamide synthase [uncultured archaeon]